MLGGWFSTLPVWLITGPTLCGSATFQINGEFDYNRRWLLSGREDLGGASQKMATRGGTMIPLVDHNPGQISLS